MILAVLSDKDSPGICDALVPIADSFLLPKIRTERAVEPEDLAKILISVCRPGTLAAGKRDGCPLISVTPSLGEAFAQSSARSGPILITGSLHFAGEALAYLQGKPAAFEECGQ